MKSSEVLKDSIMAAILMECVKNKSMGLLSHSSVLHERLISPSTRDLVYQCCLELVDNTQRRRSVGQLLLSYISTFPPSRATLQAIADKCKLCVASRSPYSSVYQELKVVVETYLNHKPLGYMSGHTLPPGKKNHTFCQNEFGSNPGYIRKCNLQPPLTTHDLEKGKNIVPISGCSDEEFTAAAKEKNKSPSRPKAVTYNVVGCKDYVNQLPLECTELLINQQVLVLNSFWRKYSTNSSVLRATSFLVKLMCDAYVSKIPLQTNYSFFRSVSICYLPTLFEMMGSTYACVRYHVYDILLTLGVHFQLVDTQGVFTGCTEALEEELVWLLLTLLRKQSLCETRDETIWTIAAKCAIVIIPPKKLHLIDCGALYQMMKSPALMTFHQQLYSTFAEAFSKRVLKWDPSSNSGDDGVALDEDKFKECGHQPVSCLLFLYRQAMTLSARLSFFQVLFTHAVMVLQSRATPQRLHSRSLRRCYNELVRVGFHWHLHSLLFYQSHQVLRELPEQITYDIDVTDMREYKTEAMAIVRCILQIIKENARLPDVIMSAFRNAVGPSVEEKEKLAALISDCVTMIPVMLREDTDGALYNIGWHMTLYCMRMSCENLAPEKSADLLEKIATSLVSFPESNDRMEAVKISSVCPDVLAALVFLGRKRGNQAIEPFSTLIEKFLNTSTVDSRHAMQLYYRLFGSIAIQNGPFKCAHHLDISQMLCNEQLVAVHSAVNGLGTRVLWALYRSLCSTHTFSACRARHVLISVLEELEPPVGSGHSCMWKEAMTDPYPPVALVGAKKILQMYGMTAYDRLDEAMSTPNKSKKGDSVYLLALKVIELAEAHDE